MSSNDFKNGMTLEIDNAPWRVIGERGSVMLDRARARCFR